MSTEYYGFPEIDPNAKFDGANDINELAQGIDSAMKQVEILGKEATYTLPAATATKLGGVRIGANINVAADGTISTDAETYALPAASQTTLGGVKVPPNSGINLAADGTISVDDKSIAVSDGSITTAKLADGSVTTAKLAKNAVTYENCAASLQTLIDSAESYTSGAFTTVPESNISRLQGNENTVKVSQWGPALLIELSNLDVTLTGSASSIDLFKLTGDYVPTTGGYCAAFGTATLGATTATFLVKNDRYTPEKFTLFFDSAVSAGTWSINCYGVGLFA